jgi:hypothetical protein
MARGFFIDSNDVISVSDYSNNEILIWSNESIYPQRQMNVPIYQYTSLFVTLNGEIYFANKNRTGRIDKFTSNETDSQFVTKFSRTCRGIIHRENSSLQSFGYLIVQIENIQSPIIVIKYFIFEFVFIFLIFIYL